MSKSAGNIIDPFVLVDKYGADALRYYLMNDIATGQDADFAEERLVERYNADLANSLGNLLNRTLTMVFKYQNGQLLKINAAQIRGSIGAVSAIDTLGNWMRNAAVFVADRMDEYLPNFLCEHVSHCTTECNETIQDVAPWEIAKRMENDSDEQRLLAAALYHLAESLRIIAILISPVLPEAAHGIFDQLNWKMELRGKEKRFSLADAEWGRLPDGHVVGQPVPLFPRIES